MTQVDFSTTYIISFVADKLCVAQIVWFVSHSPFKRPKVLVINLDFVGTKRFNCLFFRESDRAVLDRREYSGWNSVIVHFDIALAKQAIGQELTSLDGNWRELKQASVCRRFVHHVTDGKDVTDVGAFECRQYLLISFGKRLILIKT